MPDLKISQLPVASATTGAELFPVVQGGVTKQIALNAVRHIGSAVFDANGSMAVDTNTLFVDAVNNRVGVGTVTPAGVFHALTTGNTNVYLETTAAAARAGTIYQRSGVIKYYAGLGAWTGNDTYEIATATGLAVTVDTSGNLGLGVTPSAWASAAAGYSVMQIRNAAFYGISTNIARMSANAFVDGSGVNNYISNGFATRHDQVDGEFRWLTAPSGTAGNAISFTQAMTLDASGNLLVGTTSGTERISVVSSAIYQISFKNDLASNVCAVGCDSTSNLRFNTGGAERARIPAVGGMVVGTAALATSATDGFLYVPTCAGTPTGTPTTQTGTAAIVINTTNNKLYFYSGGAWRDAGP